MSIRDKRWRRSAGPLGVGMLALSAIAAFALAGSPFAAAQPAAAPARTASVAPSDIPAPPSGFTTTWSDDFTGAAGSALNTDVWRYDTGAGSGFGTGEIERSEERR